MSLHATITYLIKKKEDDASSTFEQKKLGTGLGF
jgi:hypothetical protein